MRVSLSFVDLAIEAWKLLTHARSMRSFMLPFGVLGAISVSLSTFVTAQIPPDITSWSLLASTLASADWVLPVVLLAILLGIIRTVLRGPFFLLTQVVLSQPQSSSQVPPPNRRRFGESSLTSLSFEAGYWASGIFVALVIAVPIWIALKYNEAVAPLLGQMGFILALGMLVIFFYIKEFALCYALFAKTKPRLALELGLKLLLRHPLLSLLFGLFLMTLAFLFTFAVNLAIIASDFLGHHILITGGKFLIIGIILGASVVFEETLRVLFFHALAGAPTSPLPTLEKLVEGKTPDSAPSV